MDECYVTAFSQEYERYLGKKLYGLTDLAAAEELGVLKLRRQPYLNLTGRGVLFGIADTGIDYTHPVFRFKDGRSRIVAVWDQTAELPEGEAQDIAENPAAQVPFGRVYIREQLNEALESENPLKFVPVTDENGHGTFLAGLAAGNEVPEEEFTGMAPDAEILVVKLREADRCLKKFWYVAEETPAFEEEDLIAAVDFMIDYARSKEQSLVMCFGVGTSRGDHTGNGRFAEYLDFISGQTGRAVVVAAGNEGNGARHFRSRSYEGITYQDVELRVTNMKDGLYVEFWADAPDLYGIGFVSPTGEVVEKLPVRTSLREVIPFVFEPTEISVIYERAESVTGAACIQIFMKNPVDGIWKIRIFQEEAFGGWFDLWIPIAPFVQGEAAFLKPDPEVTVTDPGNAAQLMTATAYSTESGGIALEASRGFTRNGMVKPDFAAPGVNVRGPVRGGLYMSKSGSSVAAALGAGVALLLMEYHPDYTGVQIKNYLIRGAIRDGRGYPNTEFGWGKLDVYHALENMRI